MGAVGLGVDVDAVVGRLGVGWGGTAGWGVSFVVGSSGGGGVSWFLLGRCGLV